MATTTRRRDVDAFEHVLWQWFNAESNVRAIREGNTPDWEAAGTKEAEAAASQALAAVLECFEAEPEGLLVLRRYTSTDMSSDAVLVRSLETGNLHPALNGPVGRSVFDLLQRITEKTPRTSEPESPGPVIKCSEIGDKVFLALLFGPSVSVEERLAYEGIEHREFLAQLKRFEAQQRANEKADSTPLPPQNSRDNDFP